MIPSAIAYPPAIVADQSKVGWQVLIEPACFIQVGQSLKSGHVTTSLPFGHLCGGRLAFRLPYFFYHEKQCKEQ